MADEKKPDIRELKTLLDGQRDEEIIEIGPDGQVLTTAASKASKAEGKKPLALHDPRGEYGPRRAHRR